MTNLDVIRKDLCDQIMAASPEQLKAIVDVIEEGCSLLEWIDISKMLTCEKCKMRYGCKTEDSNQDCIDNFKQFCAEEI